MPDRATADDLYRVEGQAELIGGTVVPREPAGSLGARVAGRVFRLLDDHAGATGRGEAHTGTLAYLVPPLPSGRESFSPDASYYDGPLPANPMRFVAGAPTLAVEVRSEGDRGPAAERALAAKRADYFAAGTAVVWDVDPEAAVVRVYRAEDPDRPAVYGRGQEAESEPALPGWRVAVDRVFA